MRRDWLQEPIVVLPLVAAVIFFLCLPFMLFGAQGAPQFFGAFFAALAGLAGILVGALYNASLTRKRDDRQERIKALAAARVAVSEFDRLRQNLRNEPWSKRTFLRKLVVLSKEQESRFHRFMAGEERDGQVETVEVGAWLHREVLRFRGQALATPVTDAHLLELCRQSSEISRRVTAFMHLRSEFSDHVERAFVEFPDDVAKSRSVYVSDWLLLDATLALIDEEVSLLIPALNEFLERHAEGFA